MGSDLLLIVSPVFGLIYFVKIARFCKERNVYHCLVLCLRSTSLKYTNMPSSNKCLCFFLYLLSFQHNQLNIRFKVGGSLMREGCCIQLLDEVFVISKIIKVEAGDSSRSQSLRLITLTDTLIILYMTETEA